MKKDDKDYNAEYEDAKEEGGIGKDRDETEQELGDKEQSVDDDCLKAGNQELAATVQPQQDTVILLKKRKGQKIAPRKIFAALIAIVALMAVGTFSVVKASDNPRFCTLCHNMKPYYASWNDSSLLANKHKEGGVMSCHECHESDLKLQAEEGMKYITGDYKDPLDQREFSKEFCLKCHNFDEVKATTAFEPGNPHDNHNGDLECNTCHSMHRESEVLCAECHVFSWINELDESWASK